MLRLFFDPSKGMTFENWQAQLHQNVQAKGFDVPGNTLSTFKLYVMASSPTAERLAEHFFRRLEEPVKRISENRARLANIRFWESPTSHADYPGALLEPNK
ncbi:MAG: 6-carboxytetrahydropterin synthase [Proteobacteria bacterium]|nr:6-carboxytetrahydropterin synthase [Pseudomonadota bacterium]